MKENDSKTMTFDINRRLAAECLGAFFLVATIIGSGTMAESLSAGNDAITLLANTLATGSILIVIIITFNNISGAHFNPVVSLALALNRKISFRDVLLYVPAQIIGGILGALAAQVMFSQPVIELSTNIRSGNAIWFAEVIATFGLVTTILTCARFSPAALPYAVGLFISAGYWFTSSTSFANPAVTIGRTLTNTFTGISPINAPAFIFAQIVGALFAVSLASWLLKSK